MLVNSHVSFRWATEDPNPVSKVAEKRRLEEVGQVAISSKLDTRIIDAMRSVRALEDGEDIPQPYQEGQDNDTDGEDEDSRKRRRIEAAENDEVMQRPDHEAEQDAASGLLSAEAMQGLKYFALLRQKGIQLTTKTQPQATPPQKSIGGLDDYGSDEDD